MKKLKNVKIDLYHVAGFHPNSDSCALVCGLSSAQGFGVYFSETPRMIYKGGEYAKKDMDVASIFKISGNMLGKIKVISRKRDNQISYLTNSSHILLEGITSENVIIDGVECIVYTPKKVTEVKAWDKVGNSSRIFSQFSYDVVNGKIENPEKILKNKLKHN